jgi:hypothetical protein
MCFLLQGFHRELRTALRCSDECMLSGSGTQTCRVVVVDAVAPGGYVDVAELERLKGDGGASNRGPRIVFEQIVCTAHSQSPHFTC